MDTITNKQLWLRLLLNGQNARYSNFSVDPPVWFCDLINWFLHGKTAQNYFNE